MKHCCIFSNKKSLKTKFFLYLIFLIFKATGFHIISLLISLLICFLLAIIGILYGLCLGSLIGVLSGLLYEQFYLQLRNTYRWSLYIATSLSFLISFLSYLLAAWWFLTHAFRYYN